MSVKGREETTKQKISRLMAELNADLAVVEKKQALHLIEETEAASIRKAILRSIADLRSIRC